jgi:hypothetical protein
MRTIIPLFALALVTFATPASAQMCGAGQQAQASQGGMMSGGMCAMGQTADDPMADKPAQQPQRSGMCPCCRNMAMMRGGSGGMQHHNMPGMDAPKQQ